MESLKHNTLIYTLALAFVLSACNGENEENVTIEKSQTSNTTAEAQLTKADVPEFKTIEWIDLIPKNELDILMNPPDYINEIEDGSLEDQISSKVENTLTLAADDKYQQALVSTNIIPEMDGRAIKIPGFVVPLEFNEDKSVKEFFLVPFFGACIHVPPPPPNQMLYINHPEGVKAEGISYEPFLLSGILRLQTTTTSTGTAAYTLEMHHFEPYVE